MRQYLKHPSAHWKLHHVRDYVIAFRLLGLACILPRRCLSGVAPAKSADVVQSMWYKLNFQTKLTGGRLLLHFGAIDWQATVYLNRATLGSHTGGFDGFSFDVTDFLAEGGAPNELLVFVYDPSDHGPQPNGKQRISAIDSPGGDTYTPNSGIWQTVWLEEVPEVHVSALRIDQASASAVTVSATLSGASTAAVQYSVFTQGRQIASLTPAT